MKIWIAFCSIIMVMALSSNSVAGSGTLTVTFKYKDSNGVEQPLSGAYVYLHDAAIKPPVEKYFVNTPYIFGPSSPSGVISAYTVPEGSYYIRINKRNPQSGNTNKLGPPEPTDYTWNQIAPITISANATTNLGTKYADALPITLTGTITNYSSGVPVAGRYVRAQTEPCYADGYSNNINHCGPVKFLAFQRTGADGRYTIKLRDPGTYYIYHTNCLRDWGQEYVGNPCMGDYSGSVTVNSGETRAFNIVTY
jgi:hypothetical protein